VIRRRGRDGFPLHRWRLEKEIGNRDECLASGWSGPVSRDLRPATQTGMFLIGSFTMPNVRRFRFSIGWALAALVIAVLAAMAYMTFGRTETVPDATLTLMSGQKLTTAGLRGKVYLVHFWATSCATCIKEMPQMVQTYNRFRGEHFDFVAVAMSYDPPIYVTNYTEAHHLPFRVVMDTDGSLARQFHNVQLTPTTYVIDGKGRILKRILGEADFHELHRMIEDALSESK
jgi:peroxiredoxin